MLPLTGGLGVPSSNLGAPTKNSLEIGSFCKFALGKIGHDDPDAVSKLKTCRDFHTAISHALASMPAALRSYSA